MSSNDFPIVSWLPALEENEAQRPQQPSDNEQQFGGLDFSYTQEDQLFQFLLTNDTELYGNSSLSINPNALTPPESSSDEFSVANPSEEQRQQQQMSTTTTTKSAGSNRKKPNTMPMSGRLDFRISASPNYNVTEEQLQKMTSKERRQLRNKISARNFRNRRKEYVTTLEEQVEDLKVENQQLKAELDNCRAVISQLQKENDKLRLDLVLGTQDIPCEANAATADMLVTTTTTTTQESTEGREHQQAAAISGSSSYHTPPDFETSPSSSDGYANGIDMTWLVSTAATPQWDWSRILQGKEHSAFALPRQVFQRYPLLAPALMSIVIDHTFSMSAQELLDASTSNSSSSSLLPSPLSSTPSTHRPLPIEYVSKTSAAEKNDTDILHSLNAVLTERAENKDVNEQQQQRELESLIIQVEEDNADQQSQSRPSRCTSICSHSCPSKVIPALSKMCASFVDWVVALERQKEEYLKRVCPKSAEAAAPAASASSSSPRRRLVPVRAC